MSNQKSRLGLLYLFDCIAVVLGSCVALGISKFVFRAEVRTDLMVIVLFMVAIRLLVLALGDLTGYTQKIWHTVLMVFIAEVCVVAVEYVMVFGLSQRLLIMSAAIDLILVLCAHLIWSRRFKTADVQSRQPALDQAGQDEQPLDHEEQEDQQDQQNKKVSWLLRGSVLDDPDEAPEAAEEAEPPEDEEETGEEDSGTAQDWLEDEGGESFEDEAPSETLFTREAEEEPEPADEAPADEVPAEEEMPEEEPEPPVQEEALEEPADEAIEEIEEDIEESEEEEAEAQNVEVALNHFIDILSSDAEDQAYAEAAGHLKQALAEFSQDRGEEPFASTAHTLMNQLDTISGKSDVTADMIDNVIKIAQQVESIEQVEKVVEAPNATAKKPIEARRVKKSDYHIQDGEVLLDSGDSEIIISKEDLELIRSYMKEHRQD
ncbi:MAG: hypothetical protein ACI39G_05105 [Pseudoramibacter sp.]